VPYIVNPNASKPSLPESVTSPDGKLTATVDEPNGGVLLRASYQTPPSPLAVNLLSDPSFEYGLGGISLASTATGTLDMTRARSGEQSLLLDSGEGNGGFDAQFTVPVEAGKTYTFSAWIWNPSTGGAGSGYAVRVAGALPAINGANYSTFPRDEWVQHTVTATATNTGNAVLYLYLPNAPSVHVWVDDMGFCEGTNPVDFSGDTPADDEVGYRWLGEPGDSHSEKYTQPVWPLDLKAIRFFREDGTPVRGGSPRLTVGGVAYAYDREAPCGQVVSWYAVPVYKDGTEGDRTDLVTVETAAPTGLREVWLKSISDPSLQVQVTATEVPEFSYDGRVDTQAVRGTPYPAVTFDTFSAASGSWSFYVPDAATRKALQAVITSGVVLVQTRPGYDVEDMYVVFSSLSRTRPGSVKQQDQVLPADFVEVERPPVEGEALFIPGNSWADFRRVSGTWAQARQVFPTWEDALTA